MTRNRREIVTMLACGIFLATPLLAQGSKNEQPPMSAEDKAMMEAYAKAAIPGPHHQWLADQAGTYDVKVKSWPAPGAPPTEESGTVKRSMILGGRVMVEDYTGTMMGQPMTGHGMHGYDNVTGKDWGTWTDTMITGVIMTEGTCDRQKNTCTMSGMMNDPIKKTPTKIRFNSRWTSPKTEIFEMYAPGPDGKEMKMMEMTYTKK